MNQAKIIDRVRKLLRLSQSSSVHEAEAAAAQAQRLMTRHRIDVAMLEEEDSAEKTEVHWDDPLATAKRLSGLALWRMTLLQAIADCNGCQTIIGSDHNGFDLCLIGVQSDVALVRAAYKYLSSEIDRLAMKAPRPRQRRGDARKWLGSFRQGAADRLAERVEEAAEEAVEEAMAAAQQAPGEGALVKVSDAIALLDARHEEAIRLYDDLNPDVKQAREQTLDVDPYLRGQVAAEAIALNGHRDKIADE